MCAVGSSSNQSIAETANQSITGGTAQAVGLGGMARPGSGSILTGASRVRGAGSSILAGPAETESRPRRLPPKFTDAQDARLYNDR